MSCERVNSVLIVMLLSGSLTCLGQPAARDRSLDIGSILANQIHRGPVSLLMRARLLEETGKFNEASEVYRKLLEHWPARSRWGSAACLRLARCLLVKYPADPAGAQKLLDKARPTQPDPAHDRERKLWTLIVRLHQIAGDWLGDNPPPFDVNIESVIGEWWMPPQLLKNVDRALKVLSLRFDRSGQADRGVFFFRELLGCTTNRSLQLVVLHRLSAQQLAATQAAEALVSARAYWLISAQRLPLLPDAISQVALCLEALGANSDELEQYRLWQMYGKAKHTDNAESGQRNVVKSFLQKHATGLPLFTKDIINRQKSDLNKIRLLLLNGDLVRAAPLLQRLINADIFDTRRRAGILTLVRMAFACHDGNIHNIDRYDYYLYHRSLALSNSNLKATGAKDPLRQLLDSLQEEAAYLPITSQAEAKAVPASETNLQDVSKAPSLKLPIRMVISAVEEDTRAGFQDRVHEIATLAKKSPDLALGLAASLCNRWKSPSQSEFIFSQVFKASETFGAGRGLEVRLTMFRSLVQKLKSEELRRRARLKIGRLYYENGDLGKAIVELIVDQQMKHPSHYDTLAGLIKAAVMIRVGQSDKAIPLLEWVATKSPDTRQRARSAFLIGRLCLFRNRDDDARKWLTIVAYQLKDAKYADQAKKLLAQITE